VVAREQKAVLAELFNHSEKRNNTQVGVGFVIFVLPHVVQRHGLQPQPSQAGSLCNNRDMQPIFLQNTLPLMITILVAVGAATAAGWISNSNLSKRLDDIIKRLERIEYKLDDHHERIAKLEEPRWCLS
jgi:hypothetical protein